jgi:hypothetical protein
MGGEICIVLRAQQDFQFQAIEDLRGARKGAL